MSTRSPLRTWTVTRVPTVSIEGKVLPAGSPNQRADSLGRGVKAVPLDKVVNVVAADRVVKAADRVVKALGRVVKAVAAARVVKAVVKEEDKVVLAD